MFARLLRASVRLLLLPFSLAQIVLLCLLLSLYPPQPELDSED